jgi:transposase
MRGQPQFQGEFLYFESLESMIPASHPLRPIKKLADRELAELSKVFDGMYDKEGRPSVPPERLLKGCLLIALFSLRGENHLCEQLHYNFLFRWFLDMQNGEAPFNSSVFAKNRERMMKADVAARFFKGVRDQARAAGLMSHEHLTVDGTLIEAWASQKSFQRKDGEGPSAPAGEGKDRNPDVDYKGERRSNETHASKTDPEARLARKGLGKEAKLCFGAHVVMENRHGLCVDIAVTEANGTFETDQALKQIRDLKREGWRIRTVGADKGYDNRRLVEGLRAEEVTPHVAAKRKGSALDARTTSRAGYGISQLRRKLVEQTFGWMKTVGNFRKTRYKGVARTSVCAYLTAAAYNLVRMAKLLTV